MIDLKSQFTVKIDKSGTITDYSYELSELSSQTVTETITTDDYIYVGFRKPFNSCYIYMSTSSTEVQKLSIEIFNGSSWVSASGRDDSLSFSKSGFIRWNKASMVASSIDSDELCWVRLSAPADTSESVFMAFAPLFTDKESVKQEFYELDSVIENDNLTSKMAAATGEIMDRLSQQGYHDDITAQDLHDIYEIKQSATYLTLSKIFFALSDSPDDHWWVKYEVYNKKYESSMQLYWLSIDKDDDGLDDEVEGEKKYNQTRFSR